MQDAYWRPVINGAGRGEPLAGGWARFSELERLCRDKPSEIVPIGSAPVAVVETLTANRAAFAGVPMNRPAIMGILNVTPDSFSDGGAFVSPEAAMAQARDMAAAGAAIIDIGGESTRPGADFVDTSDEIARTEPTIAALAGDSNLPPLSIDTRKAVVADAALRAGAVIFNDVTALSFDAQSPATAAQHGAHVCLMHASGDPKTMQARTDYDDVLLDIFDYLAERIAVATAAGIPRARLSVDPGIGFGKTAAQNLHLIRNLSLFHGLGCPVLLGASRKRFIGTITGVDTAADRLAGSLVVALAAARQGAQVIRVHDVAETRQALAMASALA